MDKSDWQRKVRPYPPDGLFKYLRDTLDLSGVLAIQQNFFAPLCLFGKRGKSGFIARP